MANLLFFLTITIVQFSRGDSLSEFRTLTEESNLQEALTVLSRQFFEETDPKKKSIQAFGLGVTAFNLNQPMQALAYFNQSMALGSKSEDYIHFHLGKIQKLFKNGAIAAEHFEWVLAHSTSISLRNEVLQDYVQLLMYEGRWAKAYVYLARAEKLDLEEKLKSQILFNLARAAHFLQRKAKVCEVVHKIYWKYPEMTKDKEWGTNLEKLSLDGSKVSCPIPYSIREKRISNLLGDGDLEQVRMEIPVWEKLAVSPGTTRDSKEEWASLLVMKGRLAISDGLPDEAKKSFFQANVLRGGDYSALMNLARAAAQLDNYYDALDFYTKAYEVSPNSAKGLRALFQAGFTSYVFKDYDGATRRFEEYAKKGRDRELVPYAKWQVAWIRYLKSDFTGALKSFEELSRNRYYSQSPTNLEKVRYWMALAKMRLGDKIGSEEILRVLAGSNRLGYYGFLAFARLKDQNAKDLPVLIARGNGIASVDDSSELSFPLPKNSPHIEKLLRSREYSSLGFRSWAFNELKDVEKKSRTDDELEYLMKSYPDVKNYFRSVLIADDRFRESREKRGVVGAPSLWKYAFPMAYSNLVSASAKELSVSPYMIWSVMRAESSFRDSVKSSAGAIGLMQIIPYTAMRVASLMGIQNFNLAQLSEPETNIKLGTRYLKRLAGQLNDNLPLIVAAYNAGPHRVQAWLRDYGQLDYDEFIEHIPFLETRNYVKKVLRNLFVYQVLYESGPIELAELIKAPTLSFNGPRNLKENWEKDH